MHIRKFIQKRPVATLAAVAVVAGVCLVINIPNSQSAPENSEFFYDLGDGNLFVVKAGEMPPVVAPTGGQGRGVRAYVYSCDACGKSDRFVGYIETFTDEAKTALNTSAQSAAANGSLSAQALMTIQEGTLVALPPKKSGAEPEWIVSGTPQGQQVMTVSRTRCNGQAAQRCHP